MSYKLQATSLDGHCREGIEYLPQFWEAIPKLQRMKALELEYDLAILINAKNEFHRKVKENDRPGRRHMLPFVWGTYIGAGGAKSQMQVPIRMGDPRYEREMAKFARQIHERRQRG